MIKKWKILVPIGCRSDQGLSASVIKRLKEQEWCKVHVIQLQDNLAGNFRDSFIAFDDYCHWNPDIDLVIITGDRIEMMACAEACFLNHVKIAHFYAGIITNRATFDGIHRHNITLMSDIAFCEDYNSTEIVYNLWKKIGKIGKHWNWQSYKDFNIYNVGISHLDDLEVDESLVPNESYDLVLINPITIGNEQEQIQEYENFLKYLENHNTEETLIAIGSNPDPNLFKDYKVDYDNLPRPQFLGLLKNCSRFITNSSSAYYEAPHFLKPEQIIQVGLRNKNRSTPKKLEVGASDKIVKILEEYFKNGR